MYQISKETAQKYTGIAKTVEEKVKLFIPRVEEKVDYELYQEDILKFY